LPNDRNAKQNYNISYVAMGPKQQQEEEVKHKPQQ